MELNKRYARTSQLQLDAYISYVKQHPDLLAGKNTPEAPNRLNNLWADLAARLNGCSGPTRTADAWKTSLKNWKKTLFHRARKVRTESLRTGGGVNPEADLSPCELKALEALGSIVAVYGHNVPHLGFGLAQDPSVQEYLTSMLEPTAQPPQPPTPQPPTPEPPTSPTPQPPTPPTPPTPQPPTSPTPQPPTSPTPQPPTPEPPTSPTLPTSNLQEYPTISSSEPVQIARERVFPSRRKRKASSEVTAAILQDMKERKEVEKERWEEEKRLRKEEMEVRRSEVVAMKDQQQQLAQAMALMATAIAELSKRNN